MKANLGRGKYFTKMQRKSDIVSTWHLLLMLMVLAYNNVIDDHVKTVKTQKNLIWALYDEMNRLMFDEFKNDFDMVDVAYAKFGKVAERFGFEVEYR